MTQQLRRNAALQETFLRHVMIWKVPNRACATNVMYCIIQLDCLARNAALLTYLQVVLPVVILSVQNTFALRYRDLRLLIHLQAQLPVRLLTCKGSTLIS